MDVAGIDIFQELPECPNPSEDTLAGYTQKSDWTELFFEWHKTVGTLAVIVSFMMQSSPAVKRMSRRNYLILTSLLNRCGRLMIANLRMASEDRHAEAISIIDRSLHETAIKAMWLCESKSKDRFERYLADGIKNDLRFRSYIQNQFRKRGRKVEIEDRMLRSIHRSVTTSGMSEKEIVRTKQLPDLFSMLKECGFTDLSYIVIQRMGSHWVHSTWSALLAHNVDVESSKLTLRKDFNAPHPYQLMFGSLIVLDAIRAFLKHVVRKGETRKIIAVIERYRSSLLSHNKIMAAKDWGPIRPEAQVA